MEYEHKQIIRKNIPEFGIKVAAALMDRASRSYSSLRLASNGCAGDESRPVFTAEAFGAAHTAMLMGILACIKLKRIKYFDEFIESAAARVTNSQVVIISPYVNHRMVSCINEMRHKNNTVKLLLSDFNQLPELPKDVEVYYLCGGGEAHE